MNRLSVQFLILAVLIGLNGILAGSEMAFVSLRESQGKKLERRHRKAGRAVRRLLDNPNRYLSAIQIGITLAGFLASATAAVTLADNLAPYLDFLGRFAAPVAVIVVTALLTFVTLVFGELAPKRVAMQKAERWSLLVARPVDWFASLTTPAVWLLSVTTNLVLRVTGVNPEESRAPVTEEELREMVAAQPSFTASEKEVISGALEIGDRTLQQVFRPRTEVFTLSGDLPASEGLQLLMESGHTRAPVVGSRGLDDLLGIVHLRDLFNSARTVADEAHPAVVLPETLGALEALKTFQREHQQMAVVLNEYMVAEGIVTMEDLLEEIVGEIYDEVDRDILAVEEGPEGTLLLPGSFPIHDLPDIGVELPTGPYSTLAGFVFSRLQRMPPRVGDTVEAGRWRLVITAVRGLAIVRIRLSPRR